MAANDGASSMKGLTHGLSKDKRYWRWMTIHQRCYREKNVSYPSYGAKGIKVDWVWHRDNPDGLYNFLEWIETKLKEADNPQKYIVTLNDMTKNYGPNNCSITTQQFAIQRRDMNSHSVDDVVAMRRLKRSNPEATLEDLVSLFGGKIWTISRALRGLSFSNADAIEPPLNPEEIRQEIYNKQNDERVAQRRAQGKRPLARQLKKLNKNKEQPALLPNASIFAFASSLILTSSGD